MEPGPADIPRRLGRHAIESLIGQGGMGTVYRARDAALDRTVAIKVLRTQAASGQAPLLRFWREIRLMAAMTDPRLVRIYDAGEEDGWAYLAMELLEGETLARAIERRGPLPGGEVVKLGQAIAKALATLHEAGIVHRDVKPPNVFLCREGGHRLMDLGLSRPAEGTLITADGEILGTPRYFPPEVLEGGEYTTRSDLYQLGTVLYEALTGDPFPWSPGGNSPTASSADSGPRLPALLADLGPGAAQVILACVETDPARRPADARAVAMALAQVGHAIGPSSTRPRPRSTGKPPTLGSETPALGRAIALVGGLVLLTALVVMLGPWTPSPPGTALVPPTAVTTGRGPPPLAPDAQPLPESLSAISREVRALGRQLSADRSSVMTVFGEVTDPLGTADTILGAVAPLLVECRVQQAKVEGLRARLLDGVRSLDDAPDEVVFVHATLAGVRVIVGGRVTIYSQIVAACTQRRSQPSGRGWFHGKLWASLRYGIEDAAAMAEFLQGVRRVLDRSARRLDVRCRDVGELLWLLWVCGKGAAVAPLDPSWRRMYDAFVARVAGLEGREGALLGKAAAATLRSAFPPAARPLPPEAGRQAAADVAALAAMCSEKSPALARLAGLVAKGGGTWWGRPKGQP